MVFVKFHMNRKKISTVAFKLKQTQTFFTLQQVKTMLQSQFTNVQFSFLLFSIYVLSIKKKCSFFLSFFFICCVQQCSSFSSFSFSFLSFFFFFVLFSLSCSFFSFCFQFFSFFIINCSFNVPFFFNLISTSLCPYLNSITIGSLPSLFNFRL